MQLDIQLTKNMSYNLANLTTTCNARVPQLVLNKRRQEELEHVQINLT